MKQRTWAILCGLGLAMMGPAQANDQKKTPTLDKIVTKGTRVAELAVPVFSPFFSVNGAPGFQANNGEKVDGQDAKQAAPCSDKEGEPQPTAAGNPIIMATGNKIEPETDFSSTGEMALGLTRTYNHYWKGAGLFGKHWVSTFDYKLTFGSTALDGCYPRQGGGACGIGNKTEIYAWRPDGSTIKYIKAPDGVFYEEKAQAVSRIVVLGNGNFQLHGEDDAVEVYSSAGYVISLHNAHGIGWTYSYTGGTYPIRVTHTSGRYVEFV